MTEDEPPMLAYDIHGHIFFREKVMGEWSRERNAEVQELVNRAERLARADQTALAVLKLLLSLADSAPPTSHSQVRTVLSFFISSLIYFCVIINYKLCNTTLTCLVLRLVLML